MRTENPERLAYTGRVLNLNHEVVGRREENQKKSTLEHLKKSLMPGLLTGRVRVPTNFPPS